MKKPIQANKKEIRVRHTITLPPHISRLAIEEAESATRNLSNLFEMILVARYKSKLNKKEST